MTTADAVRERFRTRHFAAQRCWSEIAERFIAHVLSGPHDLDVDGLAYVSRERLVEAFRGLVSVNDLTALELAKSCFPIQRGGVSLSRPSATKSDRMAATGAPIPPAVAS